MPLRFTSRADGDLGHGGRHVVDPAPEVVARRRAVCDLPWTWVRQVHGARVVVVDHPGAGAREVADAVVTAVPGAAIAVLTADCAPVALVGDGVVGVAHAGWRGLGAGVLEAAVTAMRQLGATEVGAVLGPCIRPECYEFGAFDLDRLAARFGDAVRGTTGDGRPALDLAAGVRVALHRVGVTDVEDPGVCTACSGEHWSHRARQDTARQGVVAWL